MSFLKRIFGKNDPETTQKVEKDLEAIQSGEVHLIYPILKPGNWIGIKAGAIHQIILGTPEQPELVLAYGYDAPDNFVFVTPDMKPDRAAVIKEAYENLEKTDVPFEHSEALNGKVLLASGNSFSSEKILSKKHMLKAHELLNADELWVSIPRRTCMMITSRTVEEDIFNKFVYLHGQTWEDDSYGNAPILNALFLVKAGEIHGMIDLDKV